MIGLCAAPALSLALSLARPAAATPVADREIALDAAPRWLHTREGYWPLRVQVENLTASPQQLTLRAASFNVDLQRPLTLGPAERWQGDILVPGWLTRNVTVSLSREGAPTLQTDAGVREEDDACVAATAYPEENPYLTPEEMLAAPPEAQRSRLFRVRFLGEPACTVIALQDLPADPAAWSSVRRVYVDLNAPAPAAGMAALAAAIRMGAAAAFYDPEGRLREDPAFAPWLEERFRLPRGAGGGWQMGLGAFTRAITPGLLEPPLSSALGSRAGGPDTLEIPIPGVGSPPVRPFAALLLGLLIALGPANYLLIGRTGRPELWLLTTPAISLVGTAGIGAYALATGGLDTLGTSRAVGVLDQRSHTLELIESRALWAGASPPRWFSPPAGVWHFPHDARTYNGNTEYEQILAPQNLLSGGFVGVRTRSVHAVHHSTTLRGRIEFEAGPDGPRARNLLGQPVALLIWRDLEGRLWFADPLAADQAAVLRPLEEGPDAPDPDALLCPDRHLGGCLGLAITPQLRPGTYAARLSGPELIRSDAPADLRDAAQVILGVVEGPGGARDDTNPPTRPAESR